jgi:hypothetical protein
MATIRIDDSVRPTRAHGPTGTGLSGGVYPMRSLSRGSGSRGRRNSTDRKSLRSGDQEAAEDEDSGLRQSGDYKKRQVQLKHMNLLTLLELTCLGFFRQNLTVACIPVDWSHLWRHWDQPSLRLFLNIYIRTLL